MNSQNVDALTDSANAPTTYNLLFVCSGNTCRSPLARVIAEAMVRDRGWRHVRIESAGTSAVPGAPASAQAVAVALEHGEDLSGHRSRPLTRELVEWADLVLAMSPAHVAHAAGLDAGHRVALVTDFLEGAGAGMPVADPFGGDLEEYRRTWDQLTAAVAAVMDRLGHIVAP
jgi:protein-tyrosine phosphatase